MVNTIAKTLLLLSISLSAISAFESYYKMRVYKDLLQSVFSKNLKLILDRAEMQQEKDVYMDEIKSKLTNIEIKIQPRGADWESLQLELFFDEGQLILEGHDLEFTGSGSIEDPTTKAVEKIEFTAPISTCQILMSIGEEYASWGSVYPRFNIEQTQFVIDETLVIVSAFGELPLYKSHQFEKAVKKWFVGQLTKRQGDFKTSLQEVEKNMWKNFPFTSQLVPMIQINSSLSEPLALKGDYLYASFINEFVSPIDYSDLEEKLVIVEPKFSNENDFKKDVQFTFDENLINNQLLGLFNADKVYSLTEVLIGWIPDTY